MNAKLETTRFLDEIFKLCKTIDIAIGLPSGGWLHPDHPAGAHLAGCDRDRAESLRGMLFVKNKIGANIFFRPAEYSPLVLLDDLSYIDAINVSNKYSTLIVKTSAKKYQAWIESDKVLSFDDRFKVQSVLIARLNAGLVENFRADPGAKGGKQIGRVPGFLNKKPKYAPDFPDIVIVGEPFATSNKLNTETVLTFPSAPAPAVASPRVLRTSTIDDQSLAEYADACRHYEKNLDIETGIQNLAERALARKKPGITNIAQAERYARATFLNASRRSS